MHVIPSLSTSLPTPERHEIWISGFLAFGYGEEGREGGDGTAPAVFRAGYGF